MMDIPYRELIGCLLYLARRTRPDKSFAVSILCRVTNDPTHSHWKAANRVLRYLLGSQEFGIEFGTGFSKIYLKTVL